MWVKFVAGSGPLCAFFPRFCGDFLLERPIYFFILVFILFYIFMPKNQQAIYYILESKINTEWKDERDENELNEENKGDLYSL